MDNWLHNMKVHIIRLAWGGDLWNSEFIKDLVQFPYKRPSREKKSIKISRTWENIFASGLFYHQSTYLDYLKSRVRPPESAWVSSYAF